MVTLPILRISLLLSRDIMLYLSFFSFFLSFFNVVVFLIIKPCKAYCLCINYNLLSVLINIWRIYALVLSFLSGAKDQPTVYESLRRPDIGLTSEYAGLTGYQNTVFITDTGMIVSADFRFDSHSAIRFQSRRTKDTQKQKGQPRTSIHKRSRRA